eukprot:NODE_3353_length_1236_cov_2.880503_g3182_i0.p1 GENE.NODE_3353_length_1236_cov_2.880503_g3182_i0~~NODE_3353_length_1236_cov_2.880503_g3182_i0.p1  ORF type:complete len:296 (+),score=66.84 NODE_3353_length_1236_cov_2.880503_g3182_i0:49-888(+)
MPVFPRNFLNSTAFAQGLELARRGSFKRSGFIHLKNILNKEGFEAMQREVTSVNANKVHFNMNGATRNLGVVSGDQLREEEDVPLITQFSQSPDLLDLLREMTANPDLQPGAHPPLSPAHINVHSEVGNQHGWHLDDAAYKLVFVARLSRGPNETGGQTSIIHDWVPAHLKNEALRIRLAAKKAADYPQEQCEMVIERPVLRSEIRTVDVEEGDAFLIEGRRTAHVVHPMTDPSTRRYTVCFSFDDDPTGSNYEASATDLYVKGSASQDYARTTASHSA